MAEQKINIKDESSEKLGLLLNSQYQELLRVQNNITAILKILEDRSNDIGSKDVKIS